MFRVVAILAGVLLIAGCSDDAAVPIDVGPTGPPDIVIVPPAKVDLGYAEATLGTVAPAFVDVEPSDVPVCVSLGENAADVAIPMQVKLNELVVRQPGGCGNFAQCGHLALFVGDVLNNESAVPSIELLTRKLGNPYHDGSIHPTKGTADLLRVTVEIIGEDGLTLLDHEEVPLTDDIYLKTVVECPEL